MTAPAVLPIPPDVHRSQDSPQDEDAWTQLEQRYQQGTAALNVVKEPVDRPRDVEQRDAKARREEAATPGTAAYARKFYEQKGYLPSVQSRELPVMDDGEFRLEILAPLTDIPVSQRARRSGDESSGASSCILPSRKDVIPQSTRSPSSRRTCFR